MNEENESALKHEFGPALLKRISKSLLPHYPAFNQKEFLGIFSDLKKLEMKPRVYFIRDTLRRLLPEDYVKALKILRKSAKDKSLSGFDLWPYTEFVQTYGLDDLDISLEALSEFTKVFTSEWAIRPFLKKYPKEALEYLEKCALEKDEHLRRWASEGTRPRLPWGERLQDYVKDPKPTLKILETLKFDPELYVRKSVANHLNDISKDHPDYVIELLKRWKKVAGTEHHDKIEWTIRRALRSLIKDGDAGSLKLIGVSTDVKIKFANFKIKKNKVKLGEKIDFEFEIHSESNQAQKLVVDYIVHFVKANQTTAPKVFKLRNAELAPKASLSFSKSHPLKKITTRDYYPGLHFIEIQVNGIVLGRLEWNLKV